MKRAIAAVLFALIMSWFILDFIRAAEMQSSINKQDAAIQLFESRHGTMTTDERRGYLDNAYQACHFLESNPSQPDLWTAMTDSGISSDAAATTIEAATTYLCG